MLRNLVLFPLTLALAVPPALAADKPPISLAKVSNWEINYDKEACHLLAKFGTGKEETIIRLTRYQPGTNFDLTLIGKPFSTENPVINVELGFGLAPPRKQQAVAGTASNGLPLLILKSQRLDGWTPQGPGSAAQFVTPEREAQVTVIDLKLWNKKRYQLQSGSMAAPMQAMRACTADLVKSWGYDPTQLASLSQPPMPTTNPGTWLRTDDYPSSSVAQGRNGIVQFRLDVAADGSVAGCHVLYRTNPDEFADLTCKLLTKRAKFKPALDQNGAPVRSFFVSKVLWMIPN